MDVVNAKKLQSTEGRLKKVAAAQSAFPDAAFYSDYREMLSEMGDKIDAVTVSTPDHHHFHASAMAMLAGKHVYCQKPLTHGIWEARMLAQIARQTGVKTQMGNQAHANDHMRRCVELIRAGIVGKVKEIHAWTNRPIWAQGFQTPTRQGSCSGGNRLESMDWPGAVGRLQPPDRSLLVARLVGLRHRSTGRHGVPHHGYGLLGHGYASTPKRDRSTGRCHGHLATHQLQRSPGISGLAQYSAEDGFKFFWYDGYVDAHFDRANWQLVKNSDEYNHPDEDVLEGMDFQQFGSVIVGEKGKLFFNRGRNRLGAQTVGHQPMVFKSPSRRFRGLRIRTTIRSGWTRFRARSLRANPISTLAGPMTETILLGVLAQRVPDTRLEWDAEKMEVKGAPN